MDAWFSSPKMFLAAARVAGYTHARLDYVYATHAVMLTITQKGKVRRHQIPLSQTFTLDQIAELLSKGTPAIAAPVPSMAGSPP